VKLYATNVKGDSLTSEVGSGGILLRKADKPINVIENSAARAISTLGLSWDEGSESGGAPVIDYKVSVSTGGDYYVLISALSTPYFTAVSLTKGTTYTFKI
jgi:hypothetical protein